MVVGTVDLSAVTGVGDHLPVLDSAGQAITLPAESQVFQARYKATTAVQTPLTTTFNIGFGTATAPGPPPVPGGITTGMVRTGTGTIANGATGGVVCGVVTAATGVPVGTITTLWNTNGDTNGQFLVTNVPVQNALVVGGVTAVGETGILEITLHYAAAR